MKLLNEKYRQGFYQRFATETDLNEVYSFFVNPFFGDAVLPQEEAKRILEKCPESLAVIREEESKELVGFYSIVSLNPNGYEGITTGLVSGTELNEKLVHDNKDKAYLAGIASFGNRAKVATLSFAYQHGIQFDEVVSVPVTEFGLHWAEKVGCSPLQASQSGLNALYTWRKAMQSAA